MRPGCSANVALRTFLPVAERDGFEDRLGRLSDLVSDGACRASPVILGAWVGVDSEFADACGGCVAKLRRLAEDERDEVVPVADLGGRERGDVSAVLEDGDSVRETEDFVQPVRDVDHCVAAVLEVFDDGEECLALEVAQRCGRFVEDDQVGLLVQGPGDGNQRLVGGS